MPVLFFMTAMMKSLIGMDYDCGLKMLKESHDITGPLDNDDRRFRTRRPADGRYPQELHVGGDRAGDDVRV